MVIRRERLRPRPFGRAKQAHPPQAPIRNTEVSPLSSSIVSAMLRSMLV